MENLEINEEIMRLNENNNLNNDNINENTEESRPSSKIQNTFSEYGSSKGFVVENPDGTFFHGNSFIIYITLLAKIYKDKTSSESSRPSVNLYQNNGFENNNNNLLRLIGDEDFLLFPPDMNEIPEFVNDIITIYLKHKNYFFWLLSLQFFLEILFNSIGMLYTDQSIKDMEKLYEGLENKEIVGIFWTFYIVDSSFSIFFYPLGFLALYKRSVKLYNWFSNLSLIGLVFEMLLAYINKIFCYIYSKFLSQLLLSLLILPR